MTTYRAHIRAHLALGLPLIGSHLAQLAIGTTDTVMLGWYSIEALAAITLAGTFFFVVFILGSGFAIAVMPMVAAALANEDRTQARRVTRMGLWIAILFSIAALPAFWFSGAILLALGQEPGLAADVQAYLRIAGVSLLPNVMIMVLKSHLAALEHTQVVLWSTVSGALLNAAVNWVLIFGNLGAPEMGLRGAAYASLGSAALMLAMLALYAARGPGMARFALFARLWRPDWEAFGQVFRLGWPIGATLLAESGLFAATAVMMGWIGAFELAAHGVAVQIAAATFMVHLGLSSAATVRAGRAWGKGERAEMRRGALAAIALSGLMAAATITAFLGIPGLLIGLFLDPADPARAAIIAYGSVLLAVAALFQLVDAMQVMALGLLRGAQDTKIPMIFAILSYWGVGVPASYVLAFPMGLGGPGLWLGLVIGLALAGLSMMARFWLRVSRG